MLLLCLQKSITTYIQTFSKLLSSLGKESLEEKIHLDIYLDTFREDFYRGKVCHVLNHFCSERLVQGPYYYYK